MELIDKDSVKPLQFRYLLPNGELSPPVVYLKSVLRIPASEGKLVRYGVNVGSEYAECDQFICSECGIEIQDWHRIERDEDGGQWHHEYVFNFCPNCGAEVNHGKKIMRQLYPV